MRLDPSSQLLVRNLDALVGERILVADSPGGELGPVLFEHRPEAQITLLQTQYGDYRRARESCGERSPARVQIHFSASCTPSPQPYDLAVVYLPKSRTLLDLMIDMAGGALAAHGRLLLVGPNRGGIQSAKPALERRFASTAKRDAARHCVLYTATPDGQSTGAFRLQNWAQVHTFEIQARTLQVVSYPGVFSHGRLDDGTRLLLETLDPDALHAGPAREAGVLDFGCGCGVIGAGIHVLAPRLRIEMVDCSALALAAARETAVLHGLPEDCVYPSDVFSEVKVHYGLIVSNPPFHSGFKNDYRVVERFLEEAAERLVDGGAFRLVANRFHRYKPLLRRHIGRCRVVAEDNRYRVYEAMVERE